MPFDVLRDEYGVVFHVATTNFVGQAYAAANRDRERHVHVPWAGRWLCESPGRWVRDLETDDPGECYVVVEVDA
jgi:hypothetical protein